MAADEYPRARYWAGSWWVEFSPGDEVATPDKRTARLCAAAERMLEALKAVHDWRGLCDSNKIETFERIAILFKRDTGLLRPGKDQPAAMGGFPTDEERTAAWNDWVTRKNDELDEAIRAAIAAATGGEQ